MQVRTEFLTSKRTNIYHPTSIIQHHPTICNQCSGAPAPEQGMSGKPQSRGALEPGCWMQPAGHVILLSEISGCWASVSPCFTPSLLCPLFLQIIVQCCQCPIVYMLAKYCKNASARFHNVSYPIINSSFTVVHSFSQSRPFIFDGGRWIGFQRSQWGARQFSLWQTDTFHRH